MLVVLDVVLLECRAVGYADREVRKYSEHLIGHDALESEVVRDFVNGEEQVLVRGAPDDISRRDEAPG